MMDLIDGTEVPTKAQKQKAYRDGMIAKGLRPKNFWIPEDAIPQVEALVKKLRDEHEALQIDDLI